MIIYNLIAKIMFFALVSYTEKHPENGITACTGNTISALPIYFFSIAVILNINKW